MTAATDLVAQTRRATRRRSDGRRRWRRASTQFPAIDRGWVNSRPSRQGCSRRGCAALRASPTPLVALTSLPALHAALRARAGLATLYGPSLTMVGTPSPSSFTVDRFLGVLAGDGTGPVPEDRERLTVIS